MVTETYHRSQRPSKGHHISIELTQNDGKKPLRRRTNEVDELYLRTVYDIIPKYLLHIVITIQSE